MKSLRSTVLILALACSTPAWADELSFSEMASFTSDLNNDVVLALPSFDTQNGARTLQDVKIEFFHTGTVRLGADNDDPFKTARVNGRMIRSWLASGPGVGTSEFHLDQTAVVFLDVDNGDGANFDPTPPDGTNFGGPLAYAEAGDVFFPSENLYATNGPGTVNFTVDVLLMINDLQFNGPPPDRWTLEVQDPRLTVETKVTYTFIPEPASLLLLAAGGAGLLWRRRMS